MELIVAETLGLDRLGLYLNLDRPMTEEERERSRQWLARRREREPLAYILGRREFYGLTFEVSPAVLIPRPETECLVDRALAWLRAWNDETREPVAADIGTGSGAIAVATAAIGKKAGRAGRWIASDICPDAIQIAQKNAEVHGVDEDIEFRLGATFEVLESSVDLICSNPPYVAEADRASLAPEVAKWEPAQALFSASDGLAHLGALIAGAAEHLNPGGTILLEIGFGQRDAVQELFEGAKDLEGIVFHRDLAGIDRIAEAHRRS